MKVKSSDKMSSNCLYSRLLSHDGIPGLYTYLKKAEYL